MDDTVIIIIASVVAFLLLSFCVYLFMIKPGKRREGMEKFKNVRYAHRGLHGEAGEENSLSAFRAATDAGFGIELDVRLSSDGVLVVFHDDTLDRVTKESGRVDSRTYEELSKIKLGETLDTIPTFEEVLSLVDGRVPLLVEIKEDAGCDAVTKKTVEILKSYKGDYIIESFNPLSLGKLKSLYPEAMRGQLSDMFMKQKKFRKPMYFLLQTLALNVVSRPDFIAYSIATAKSSLPFKLVKSLFRVPTLAWTVRSDEEEKLARRLGFDGIIFENYIPK